jgi:hypothetical protein
MAINYLNSIDLNKNELLQGVIENQPNDAAAGSSPVTGQVYYNTTDFELRQYNGTAWVSVGDITSLTPGTNISITNPGTSSPTINVVDAPTFAGNLTISKNQPVLIINDTVASDLKLEIKQSASTTVFKSRGGTSSTGQFNFQITNGSTTTNALFINQQARATFAGDVVIDGGDITLGGTGRIQGVDTVTDGTDATNKTYVDNAISGVPQGTLTGLGEGTYIDIDNTAPAVPIINVEGTEAATASKLVARDSNGFGYVATPASGDSSTKIATTAFVQSSLTGLLEFKGGFNANTGAIVGGGNLTSGATRVAIAVGDYYVVTADGDFFGLQGTPLTVGDSVIVQTAAAAGASTAADFIVVQSDTDLATLTTIGLGNVNINGAGDKDGLSLSYSAGTATLGLDINSLPYFQNLPASDMQGIEIPVYDGDVSDANKKVELQDLIDLINSENTYSVTITDTATITHNLGTKDVIIQLYDTVTSETVYADVLRVNTSPYNTATITFASTPTNSIRVLVQKIG